MCHQIIPCPVPEFLLTQNEKSSYSYEQEQEQERGGETGSLHSSEGMSIVKAKHGKGTFAIGAESDNINIFIFLL